MTAIIITLDDLEHWRSLHVLMPMSDMMRMRILVVSLKKDLAGWMMHLLELYLLFKAEGAF